MKNIRVVRTDSLENLEREVAVLKNMGWKPTGEAVPFWEDGYHCLEMGHLENWEDTPETHFAGFNGEEFPWLNELSELRD